MTTFRTCLRPVSPLVPTLCPALFVHQYRTYKDPHHSSVFFFLAPGGLSLPLFDSPFQLTPGSTRFDPLSSRDSCGFHKFVSCQFFALRFQAKYFNLRHVGAPSTRSLTFPLTWCQALQWIITLPTIARVISIVGLLCYPTYSSNRVSNSRRHSPDLFKAICYSPTAFLLFLFLAFFFKCFATLFFPGFC